MGAVTTLPAFLDALRAALVARTAMANVNVFSGDVDPEAAGAEFVILAAEDASPEFNRITAPKRQTFEEYDVPCFLWIAKPGAGESAIKAARDRAFVLLEDVTDYLDGLTGSATMAAALGVRTAKVSGYRMVQSTGESLRHCQLHFTIHVTAEFTPA